MRHAAYWVPAADHPLWHAGCAWLGRDPTEGAPPGVPPAHAALAWRYGFHATLKAPLRLQGADTRDWADALAAIARAHSAAVMPPLSVQWLRDYLVLMPEHPLPEAFASLGADCVERLDPWRTPFDEAERARRSAGLDDGQLALFERWGYPHVFHRWQLHLTLSDAVPAQELALRDDLTARARAHFAAALSVPVGRSDLGWFVEPEPAAPFRLVQRFPIGTGA